MSQIEWAMWANEQALMSSFVLLLGSVLGVAGMFSRWQFGIYGIIASLFMIVIEWPRSRRKMGKTVQRKFQKPFAVFVNKLGIAGSNYFIRFVTYFILGVPCFFILATLLGGICFLITGALYLLAAMKGEEWCPSGLKEDEDSTKRRISIHPPKKPPPHSLQQLNNEVSTTDVTMEIMEESTKPQKEQSSKSVVGFSTKQGTSKSSITSPKQHVKPVRPSPCPKTAAFKGIQDPNG